VWFFGERFDAARAAGFVLIWLALLVYALDGVLRARAANAARA
jgi:chloramphenicol-sensitive protein RarD